MIAGCFTDSESDHKEGLADGRTGCFTQSESEHEEGLTGGPVVAGCFTESESEHEAGRPQGGNKTRRQRQAAFARKCLAERRRKEPSMQELWGGDLAKAQAVRQMVEKPLHGSRRQQARDQGVPRQFLETSLPLLASEILSLMHERFEFLMTTLLQLACSNSIVLILFAWFRQYDETPAYARVETRTEEGDVLADQTAAKVMATRCKFTVVFSEGVGDALRIHRIHGQLLTRLRDMASQTAANILESIRDTMLPPLSEKTRDAVLKEFQTVEILRSSDMHKSNIAAEREESRSGTWKRPSSLFRCGLHRSRTGEKRTLTVDAEAESFLVNVTLSLRVPGAGQAIRRRIEKWALEPTRLKRYIGTPSKRVQDLRATLRPLLFPSDAVDTGTLARQYAWDTVFTGDPLNDEEVQHFCAGPTCCPKGMEDTRRKVKWAVRVLWHPLPCKFPRKSWQGQHQSCAHVWLLTIHGMVQQNFCAVQDTARWRAEKMLRMLQKQPGTVAASHGAQDAGDRDEPDRMQAALQSREDAFERCTGVMAFLEQTCLRTRIVQVLLTTACFGDLKRSYLELGEEWDLREMASQENTLGSRRSHAVARAAGRGDVRAALVRATAGAHGVHDTLLQSCLGRQEASFDWRMRSFRMWCRAGAEIYTIVWGEQKLYPWRAFDADVSVEEILADVARGRRCWVDRRTVAHVDKYPTVEKMKSAPACAEREALAREIEPTTAAVERGHAHMKRTARPHEETHAQRVRDASANRIVSQLCREHEAWYAEVAGRDFPQAHALTPLQTGAEQQPKKGRKRKAVAQAKPQKKRCGARCRAWMQANKGEGQFSAALFDRYREAMEDPEEARKYTVAGMALHAAGGVARKPRRLWSAVDTQLREARTRAKRLGQAWCPKDARTRVQSQMQEHWNAEWVRRKKDLREKHRARRQRNADARIALTKPEAMVQNRPLPKPLAEVLGSELVREPDSSWRWFPAVRNAAEQRVAARVGMKDRLLQWESMHYTLDSRIKVRPETVGARRRRLCMESGRCLWHGSNRPFGAFVGNFRDALFASAGCKRGQPKTQTRIAIDNAAIIIRFTGGEGEARDQEWCLLARVQWDSRMATFVHLREIAEDGARASLRVQGRVSVAEPFLGWYLDHEFFERFDLQTPWHFELWAFQGLRAERGGHVLTAATQNSEQRQIWKGGDDVARAMAQHEDDEDDACSDTSQEGAEDDREGGGTDAASDGAESPVARTDGAEKSVAPTIAAKQPTFDSVPAEVMERARRIL